MPPATSIFLLLLYCLVLLIGNTEAHKRPRIEAVFAFGDSIFDTGNNNHLGTFIKCNFPPYGKDFPSGIPSGRFGDGRVLSDMIADGLRVKRTIPAYLDPNLTDTDLSTGVCFASGGSGLDSRTSTIQSILSINDQLYLFKEYIQKLKRAVGVEQALHILRDSQYLISTGNNDIAITYYGLHLRLEYDISLYTSQLISWASAFIKELHRLGARRIAFLSTAPLGCLPAARTLLGGPMRVCVDFLNQAAKMYNSKLAHELRSLNNSLDDANIFYVDLYNPLLTIIENPQQSGFDCSDRGCCGTGVVGIGLVLCNRLNPFTCSDASKYVFWDSIHPSQRAYKIIAHRILDKYQGNFGLDDDRCLRCI